MRVSRESLEPALRNDEDIAWTHLDVRTDVTALHEVPQANAVKLAAVCDPKNTSAVPIGEVGKSTSGDHDVEHRHVLAIGECLRLGRFADHANLLAGRADECRDDYSD